MQAVAFSDLQQGFQDKACYLGGWGHTVVELNILWKMHSKDLLESSILLKRTNKSRPVVRLDLIPEESGVMLKEQNNFF